MKFNLRHTTRYVYEQPVSSCHNLAYMLPRNTPHQQLHESLLITQPAPAVSTRRDDYFGNQLYQFSIETLHTELEVTATSVVEVSDPAATINLDFGNTCAYNRDLLYQNAFPENVAAREFLIDSPLVQQHPELAAYAASSFTDERPFLSAVMELTQRIYTDFTYDPVFTDVATPVQEVFKHQRGVCQDFAHLAIACLRSLGYPARYVSGYLETLPAPGEPKLIGADASHAWFAVYSPGEGWYDFDPTNNQMVGAHHITTAWGRDYSDVTPLRGVIFGGGNSHELSVSVDVQRLGVADVQA